MRLRRGVVVLWREPGTTQVGVAQPLVFTGLDPHDQHALASLEGPGLGSTARMSRAGREALAAVDTAGLLESADARDGSTIAIHGLGALGLALAVTLARSGHALVLHDNARVVAEAAGTFGARPVGSTCAAAAADAIRALVPGTSVRIGAEPGDVTVVIGVATADPASWIPLMAGDRAHMLVAADESGVDVGPFVIPGRSACGGCLGLARAQDDPAWPIIALQAWSGRRPHAEPDVATMAAGLIAAAIGAHLHGGAPWARNTQWADNTQWAENTQWRCVSGRPPTPVPVRPHPDCGCGAAAGDSVGPAARISIAGG